MKILMITHYSTPRIGGVEKVVEELAQCLKGHEVTIIAEKHEKGLKSKERLNAWTTIYRFEFPHKKYIGLLYIWKWMFQNRNLIRDADIVHIHDVFIWYLPFRFLFPFKPVYMTFHGWEGAWPIPWKSSIQKKLAYYLTKGNICVGKYLEKYYDIIADIITYGGTTIPKRQSKKLPRSFVYVGRLDEGTGLQLVLESLNYLKNYTIEFCGDGDMRKECEKFGKVHGFLKDPGPYLAKAEFCFAGGYLTTLEAMSHGCMVVLCYQNALKEDAFKTAPFAKYIIIKNSPEKVAQEVKYYLKNRKKMKVKIEKGYEWVTSQTWEHVADQYQKLWKIDK